MKALKAKIFVMFDNFEMNKKNSVLNYQKGLSNFLSQKETNLNNFLDTLNKELLFWFRSSKEIVKNHTLGGFLGMPNLGIVRFLAPMVSGELLTK